MLNQPEEEPKAREQERRGKGVNATVFWVTHNLMSDWIQLPDIEPHQIVAARHIVKLFTGNLNASIDSNPQFPGKERHLLRAQLARIQHTCELSIKGEFEIDEETNEVKPTEEFSVPATEDLRSLESWGHKNPIILKAGRCTHIEPLGMDEEALQEFMDKLAEDDKTEERFKAINENSKVKGQEAWTSQVCGDLQPYNKANGDGTISYAINVIRSVRWPGAVTLSKNGKYFFIYVGDGIKRGADFFSPTEPPEVFADPREPIEEPEPNGKEPEAPKEEGAEEDE